MIGIVVGGITALAYVIFAFAADPVLGLLTLVILAPIAFLLYVIYTRVILELLIAIFRIMETNTELVHLQRGTSGGPPPSASSAAAAAVLAAAASPPPYTPPPSDPPPPGPTS